MWLWNKITDSENGKSNRKEQQVVTVMKMAGCSGRANNRILRCQLRSIQALGEPTLKT